VFEPRFPRIRGTRWHVLRELLGSDANSVLDIGCRDRRLREWLPEDARYVGLDLSPPADVIADAEEPLPFEANSFRSVVLADVLEHLDNPHAALDDALRVASSAAVIVLPNVYHALFRLRFARGRLGAKYMFGPEYQPDHHRWVLGFSEAASFTHARAQASGWHVAREYAYDGGFSRGWARVAVELACRSTSPDFWAWDYTARLDPLQPGS
jgi:SAM-dependent methyltransferase